MCADLKRITARLCLRTGTPVTELRKMTIRDLLDFADEVMRADKERKS